MGAGGAGVGVECGWQHPGRCPGAHPRIHQPARCAPGAAALYPHTNKQSTSPFTGTGLSAPGAAAGLIGPLR